MVALILVFLVFGGTGPILAQENASSKANPTVIEEIIVTATKRGETSLQDTAMSISAIGQQAIQYLGADDMLDYLLLVPNVSFKLGTPTGDRDDIRGGRRLTIRGIDSGAGYTDAKFTETSPEVGVTDGDGIGNSAKFTGSLSGLYQRAIGGSSEGYAQISVVHTGDKFDG